MKQEMGLGDSSIDSEDDDELGLGSLSIAATAKATSLMFTFLSVLSKTVYTCSLILVLDSATPIASVG